MKRYVRIYDSSVVEIVELPDDIAVGDVFHPDVAETLRLSPSAEIGWVVKGKTLVAPPEPATPPAPALTRLHKATLWRRLDDDEAEALDLALAQAPVRLRRIFEAAQYLDTTDDDYAPLRAGVEAALGSARADEVLQPDHQG